jgi:hypothetical protein
MSSRVRVPPAEPLKALHFFLNGTDPSLDPFAELAQKSGHTVAFHAEEMSAVKMIDSQVLGKLQRWMRLLEAY